MPFIGKQSSANSKIKKYSYTATANQTNFAVVSGGGDELQVFFNGVKLKEIDDYTFSTSQVTLGSPASAGDIVDIHVFSSFLIADAVSSSTGGPFGTGNNEWSLPVTRASENGQFLQMSDISNGTTAWASSVTDPSITGVTGHLNATEATGEGGGGTLVITGADLGTNISQVTDVSICNSSGGSSVPATTKSVTSSNTEITATWTGNENGYSTFTGVYYVKLTKSGKTSNIFNTTKSFSADPTISSVTGVNGDLNSSSVSASDLGTYGGTIPGGGQDSNTKLLLNFDRSGGTDIEDSSNIGGEGHKVTVSGNAVIKASPFGDGKSAIYYGSDTDKLVVGTAQNSDFDFGTGAFTIEFWVNIGSYTGSADWGALVGGGATTNKRVYIEVNKNNGDVNFYDNNNAQSQTTYVTWSGLLSANTWHHVAIVRTNAGTSINLYKDGSSVSGTVTNSIGSTDTVNFLQDSSQLHIGHYAEHTSAGIAGFWMDEIRIVKGTAVYTSDFDVPNSRFSASDEANTVLLIHSDRSGGLGVGNRNDNITVTSTSNLLPAGTTGTYQQLVDGDTTSTGTAYPWFNNGLTTGHLLFDFGVSEIVNKFTWIQGTSVGHGQWTFSGSHTNETSSFTILSEDFDLVNGNATNNITFSNSTAYRYYKLEKTGTGTTSSNPYTHEIQFFNTADTDGKATEVGKFKDVSTTGHTITPTGSYHSQAHGGIAPAMAFPASLKKTGSAGVYFDGTGDYLEIPYNADLNYGVAGQAYSIDMWIYPTEGDTSNGHCIYMQGTGSGNRTLLFYYGTNGLTLYTNSGSASINISTSSGTNTSIPLHQWSHIALTRDTSGVHRIYINGKYQISGSDNNANGLTSNHFIGKHSYSNTSYFKGYIDCVRFQKDVVLYNSSESATNAYTLPTKIYGAMFPRNPSVGTITITGATTDSTDIAFEEINNSLPNGLELNDQGAGNQTATITGTLTDSVTSDTTTSNIRIQAKANNDAKRITEVNENSNGSGEVSITKKAGGAPVLFNARRYVGNGDPREITGYGLQPDLVWGKRRNGTNDHWLVDNVRGFSQILHSNTNGGQSVDSNHGAVSKSDGFSVGNHGLANADTGEYIAWGWKAGGAPTTDQASQVRTPTSGALIKDGSFITTTDYWPSSDIYPKRQSVSTTGDFSITRYTGTATGTNQTTTIPHGLSGTPDLVIVKNLDGSNTWIVKHSGVYSTSQVLRLDTDLALSSPSSGYLTNLDSNHVTATSSTNITAYGNNVNRNGINYIMYAWKAVSGVSAFGSYTGQQSGTIYSTSPTYCGFKPSFVMIKSISQTSWWVMYDKFRLKDNAPANQLDPYFGANDSSDTYDPSGYSNAHITLTDNGFTTGTDNNVGGSGRNYIWMAFA